MLVYASDAADVAQNLVDRLNSVIIFPLMTLLTAAALLVFLWGGLQFIIGAGDETARKKGKQHMLWGIVGLLIILSAYTILRIAAGTFGIGV
jgi:phosphotransferase system  glucose/maltose/N-acetylglucosamine-specific IIC component